MFGVAFVISVLYTILMRWFAGCFLWTFIILFMAILVIIGFVTLTIPYISFLQNLLNYDSLPTNLKNRGYQIGCGVLSLGSALITIIIVSCMRR
jgi:MFS-type transporter involved in bile tolerance (Atg22 family)